MSEPVIALRRTCARHERGTLLVLIALLAIANGGMLWLTCKLLARTQLYSVPDVYRPQDLQIHWGAHD